MTISLTVDSYYEYFLTLLGWFISNNLWELITKTGIIILPFIYHLYSSFMKVREQGEDEGNKGVLLVNWLENKIYTALFILVFCCIPVFTVSYSSLTFPTGTDYDKAIQCGRTVYVKPESTSLGNVSSELNGKSVKLPIWWAFTYSIGKGLTHGAIASLPCRPDLRQLRFEVQHTQIKSPVLRQEIEDFVAQCFVPSRAKIKRQQIEVNSTQARDIDWIGSTLLLNTSGFYDTYRSQSPRSLWDYDPVRDVGLPNTGYGGYPNCRDWWSNGSVGLRGRLLQQVEPDTLTKAQVIFKNKQDYEDVIIRSIVRPVNLKVSNGFVYNGYGRDLIANSGWLSAPVEAMNAAVGTIASTVGAVLTGPIFDTIKQSLPMLQGVINLTIIVAIPIVLVLGAYTPKVVVTISIFQFGTFFLTFLWEMARWLDSWILTALYGSDTHSYWNIYGMLNTADDINMNVVNSITFLLIPALWFGMISWAGIQGGSIVAATMKNGADQVNSNADKGMNKMV